MKKTFTILSIAAIFAACSSNTKQGTETGSALVLADSINQNAAAADKAQPIEMNGLSDTIVASDGSQFVRVRPGMASPAVAAPRVRATAPRPYVRPTVSHSPVKTNPYPNTTAGTSAPSPAPAPVPSAAPATTGTETAPGNGTVGNGSADNGSVAQAPAETEKKKGWSKAAKGAVIGAGTGAVAGAVIGKKKGTGAIIGGILGAGGGYVIGRAMDKKDGRY